MMTSRLYLFSVYGKLPHILLVSIRPTADRQKSMDILIRKIRLISKHFAKRYNYMGYA